MTWRVAESLLQLQVQLDEAAPDRAKPDGFIGDADHQNRTSDHNPWCDGVVVTAGDFKDDDDAGANMRRISESLRQSQDKRIKYVIHEGQMFSSYPTSTHAAWTWRPYSGPNGHFTHMHISVQCDASKDSTAKWQIGEWDEMATKAEVRKLLRDENKKSEQRIQTMLDRHRRLLAVGKDESYRPRATNIKKAIEGGK